MRQLAYIILTFIFCLYSAEAHDPFKLTTEYQFKLKTKVLKDKDINYVYEKIAEAFAHSSLKFSKVVKPPKVFHKIMYLTGYEDIDKRISIRSRCWGNKSDLAMKYNSASLGEILILDLSGEYKLEQDIYDRYTKFSITFERSYDGTVLRNLGEVYELFPKNEILKHLNPKIRLNEGVSFVRRDKSLRVISNGLTLKLTLDLAFEDLSSAINGDLSKLQSGELSFRVKSSNQLATGLAASIFELFDDFELSQDDYTLKNPRYYY